MTLALSVAACQEIYELAQQHGEQLYQHVGVERCEYLPQLLGRGSERKIPLRHGFSVTIRDAQLGQAIRFENPHGQCFPLISKFHLSGNSRV
ncbi:MAG: AraC family transcriptional regulator, partial [Microcoleus sp. SIO2G3]|nr:AraC family transcriptional regulator [Microcoleus sp. SIO2G3]